MSLVRYTNKTPKIWYASGVIIFNHDLTKTIIVKTPKGNIGFPKGGKELGERLHQTAHREVLEETGLSVKQYNHDNMLVGEKKGNPDKGNNNEKNNNENNNEKNNENDKKRQLNEIMKLLNPS